MDLNWGRDVRFSWLHNVDRNDTRCRQSCCADESRVLPRVDGEGRGETLISRCSKAHCFAIWDSLVHVLLQKNIFYRIFLYNNVHVFLYKTKPEKVKRKS